VPGRLGVRRLCLRFDVRGVLHRMSGVDLTAIEGIDESTAILKALRVLPAAAARVRPAAGGPPGDLRVDLTAIKAYDTGHLAACEVSPRARRGGCSCC